MNPRIYSDDDVEGIFASGQILAEILERLRSSVNVGVSLLDLDSWAREMTDKKGATPAFLGYRPDGADRPYPAAICASVNEVVVHGIPTDYRLKGGDVLKIDFGVIHKGFYSDAAITVGVGEISKTVLRLIQATETALVDVIPYLTPQSTLGDLGWVIADTARRYECTVIKGLTGHGIGRRLHEPPSVLNEGVRGRGLRLMPGMVLAVEPMFSLGSASIIQLQDESWATVDHSLAAHFEHTIAITSAGPRVLTKLA